MESEVSERAAWNVGKMNLSDLRVLTEFDGSMARPVTAAEVASVCPTEVLIEVLVDRGVLTPRKWHGGTYETIKAQYFTDWIDTGEPVAGGVS